MANLPSQRFFRQATRQRLLIEMLRSSKGKDAASDWRVLVMDEFTVKVMSHSCKMADITEEGISLVEDLNKRRQPLPGMEAVYFIQPKRECVQRFCADMSGRSPLYKKAFIFFSSPIQKELLKIIKSDPAVLSRIGALKEMNLEYLLIDSQAFSTDCERALEQLFVEPQGNKRDSIDSCLDIIACRLATVFASLKEFPIVRYRAAKSAFAESTVVPTASDLVPTKLAANFWNQLTKYKDTLQDFPATETCDLIILDRSIDPIAPVMHDWTYDALCHDLLNMEGNKYTYEAKKTAGNVEKKDVLLEEHDTVWLEMRDLFIAEVNIRLSEKFSQFASKNKAAQIQLNAKEGTDLSTRDMKKLVEALSEYREQQDKLSTHIDIATKLNSMIKDDELSDIGSLEQDFVFGSASSKELINILSLRQGMSKENKIRLLMIYMATHPEDLDPAKRLQWMKLARLTEDDMHAVANLGLLGVSVLNSKKQSGVFPLSFGHHKNKRPVRKEKNRGEDSWKLCRFFPVIEEIIEALSKDELSKEEYPYVKEPAGRFASENLSARTNPNSKPAVSVRTKRPGSTWASRQSSDDGSSSDSALRHAHSDPKVFGKRIFVFIVGGIARSELRAVRMLAEKLHREIILGSTSLDDPHEFVAKLKLLSFLDEISLDDLDLGF